MNCAEVWNQVLLRATCSPQPKRGLYDVTLGMLHDNTYVASTLIYRSYRTVTRDDYLQTIAL